MPLYDCGAEDCEECQVAFRGVKVKVGITREEIIALVHEHYDPEPKDWPRHRGWDDGAGDIANRILARMGGSSESGEKCPRCGLKAESMLHKFCTHADCPPRSALAASEHAK
jgi:hypothetical protein